MEELYHRTKHEIEEVNRCFQKFDSGRDEQGIDEQVDQAIEKIITNCDRLDILVHKEPATRRHVAKLRVDQLKYDARHLKAAQTNLRRKREDRKLAESNREELLRRSFRANEATSIDMDQMLNFHSKTQDANRNVDDLISSGGSILDNLRDQRNRLKGTRRRILDVVNHLGMSNTVMRLIEKRSHQDKFILFGGMILTCIIMILIVVYFWR